MPDTTYHSGDYAGETMADVIEARSLVSRVLKTIAREGPYRGEDAIERLIVSVKDPGEHISKVEMTRVVSSLNRAGKVHTRGSQRGDLTLIEATRRGYVDAGVPYPVGGEVGSRAHPSPAQHRTDATDFRNHGPVAQGGEITRSRTLADERRRLDTRRRFESDGSFVAEKIETLPEELAWDAVIALSRLEGVSITEVGKRLALSPSPTTIRIRKAQALGWVTAIKDGPNGSYRLYLTPAAKDRLKAMGISERVRSVAVHPTPMVIEPREVVRPVETRTPSTAYPHLAALVLRAGELIEVADRLEALGHDDAALAVLATLDDLTLAEREIVSLIRRRGISLEIE